MNKKIKMYFQLFIFVYDVNWKYIKLSYKKIIDII